jgi:hypothetical protein
VRSGRTPTGWGTPVKSHRPVLPDSAVGPQASRSTGPSSPAPNGGFADSGGRPVGGAHETPRCANCQNHVKAPPSTSEVLRPSEVGGSVTRPVLLDRPRGPSFPRPTSPRRSSTAGTERTPERGSGPRRRPVRTDSGRQTRRNGPVAELDDPVRMVRSENTSELYKLYEPPAPDGTRPCEVSCALPRSTDSPWRCARRWASRTRPNWARPRG